MFTILLFTCVFVGVMDVATAQDCIAYGRRCSDTSQCCGGCCISGVCIDTYRPCNEIRNPCLDRYCPGGMECTVFKPEKCPECDVQAICN